jgi:DNA-binding NarL/FixJ family response regulator
MTRVLIADPNPTSRRALALLLTHKLGVDVICNADHTDALIPQILDCQPDLILLADDLPGLDFPQTCLQLREKFPTLSIVLLSVDETIQKRAANCKIPFIHKAASLDETLFRLKWVIEISNGELR